LTLSSHDLISIDDLTDNEIDLLLETGRSFKDVSSRAIKKVPTLRGRTVVNLFLEPSTRTRASFEIAGKRLSADVINVSGAGSSVVKGESLKDTAKTVEAMNVDAVVLRHWSSGAALKLAEYIEPPVINAGDGFHEHPTQALLDLMTLEENLGSIEGANITIVGDISHSRVARSLIVLLNRRSANVTVVAPPTLLPSGVEQLGCRVSHSFDEVIGESQILYLLRIQKERFSDSLFPGAKEYAALYGLTKERWARAPKGCRVLHPGPMNRGVEIDSGVADGLSSLINEQVTNGVAIRMAVLYLLVGRVAAEGSPERESKVSG
jgi:aspartate carbamoyltransferase catalytic subunit